MSLRHAILGFLQTMPMTGYGLKIREFDRSVAYFWPAALPQIYRELERMEKHGWIKRKIIKQVGRPDRHECHITPAGRAELRRWLHTYQDPPKHREAFLIQLFLSAELPNDDIIGLLEYQLQVRQERLAELKHVRLPRSTTPAQQRREILAGLTLDLGLRLEQVYVDWLTGCITLVRNGLPA
jgi:PadR family transcriptional regulator, regulatory protein AphA